MLHYTYTGACTRAGICGNGQATSNLQLQDTVLYKYSISEGIKSYCQMKN